MLFTTLNIAVFEPMPSASVKVTSRVNPGRLSNVRTP
jgi:hypothetical protein